MADDEGVWYLRENLPFEIVAQRLHPRGALRQVGRCDFQCFIKSDGERDVLGSRPQTFLLKAAVQLRLELDAVPQHERADAQRAVELVRGDGHRIDAEVAEMDGDFADSLDGVGV